MQSTGFSFSIHLLSLLLSELKMHIHLIIFKRLFHMWRYILLYINFSMLIRNSITDLNKRPNVTLTSATS